LRRAVRDVGDKMRIQHLKEPEGDDLVKRTDYKEILPRVDYSLTPLGRSLAEALTRVPAAELEAQPLLWLDIDGERADPAFQIANDRLLPTMGVLVEAFAIDRPWQRVKFMLTGDARPIDRRMCFFEPDRHVG
jgi:hypothetical protein